MILARIGLDGLASANFGGDCLGTELGVSAAGSLRGSTAGFMGGSGGNVVLINGDVEAGLPEFFFDVDHACGLKREKLVAHPRDFAAAEARFGDVNRGASDVRTDDIALGCSCVAVDSYQSLLILDRSDG